MPGDNLKSAPSYTAPSPSPPSPPTLDFPIEEPYSIFDKRQKALIVVIISTAATCTPFNPSSI